MHPFLFKICVWKYRYQKDALLYYSLWFKKYWSDRILIFKKKLVWRLKKRHFAWLIQYAKVEESNSRAREVIPHPAEKPARVNPSSSSAYRVVHIHRSTWRDERASGAPVVPARSWHVAVHVAVLTSGLFIPTSLVCRCVRGSPSRWVCCRFSWAAR